MVGLIYFIGFIVLVFSAKLYIIYTDRTETLEEREIRLENERQIYEITKIWPGNNII